MDDPVRPAARPEVEIAGVEGYDVATLIGLVGATQIDLLKIDIEGSERELFERNTDKWLPNIRNLCVELHDDDSRATFFSGRPLNITFDCSRSGELTVCSNLRSVSLRSESRRSMSHGEGCAHLPIDVIIPVYGERSEALAETLHGCLNQTVSRFSSCT